MAAGRASRLAPHGRTLTPVSPLPLLLSQDLGFNDVGFHGSKQIPTPHIDSIAKEGVTLNNYHVQPVCSPTRSTIMSGRHVIHTGIYMPFSQGTNLRLHLNYTLLPGYLKKLGYATHMVGKWCVSCCFAILSRLAVPTHNQCCAHSSFASNLSRLVSAPFFSSVHRKRRYDKPCHICSRTLHLSILQSI